MMSFSLDIDQTRGLGNLKKYDIIEYESEYIDLDVFMVVSIERDDEIPAILLQLWQFDGGYNHAFKNVMENDLGVNTQVPYFEPTKRSAVIEEITEYRPEDSGLSKKEELFFDVWPQSTSSEQEDGYQIPYKTQLRYEDGSTDELIIPSWTPLQRLPIARITSGTEVEIWEVNSVKNIMRVTQL